LTVGASLSLAQAMISTGTVDWLGQQFILVFTGGPQKPFLVLGSIIIAVAIVHIAITNLAACVALIIPIVLTIAHTAGLQSGYFGTMDVGRLGLTMLALTILVGLCVAVPYWSFLGLPLMVY
jgi:solute carrier family 13 (sodium-dependent dicarboxylate transporter), member 2/3/5